MQPRLTDALPNAYVWHPHAATRNVSQCGFPCAPFAERVGGLCCRGRQIPRAPKRLSGRPIQLVVPVPPGGAADFLARTVGAKLADALGQSVVIVNRGGAGGTIATASVAKAEPDGYTLLLNSITTHGIGPHLYSNLSVRSGEGFPADRPGGEAAA